MPTLIGWTNETWNPVTGCSRVSAGCDHCYAEALSLRYGWSKLPWTGSNSAANVVLHPERLRKPSMLKKPSLIFVNSMSDLFHPRVPDEYIAQVFDVMAACPQHTFQVLTKRPQRAAKWGGPWSANVWMGTTVENDTVADRIDILRQCPAAIRFLSVEPMIGPLTEPNLSGIDWVICGGESGSGYRSMDMGWARDLRDTCVRQHVAFFFKQDSAYRTETRPWLVEADGSRWKWEQYPGNMGAPMLLTE